MAALGQRSRTARAIAVERAYSPMPYGPDTGMNKMRGAASVKGGEPAIEHPQRPSPAKTAAHGTLQHAACPEPLHRFLQEARMAPEPAMHRQPKPGLRTI